MLSKNLVLAIGIVLATSAGIVSAQGAARQPVGIKSLVLSWGMSGKQRANVPVLDVRGYYEHQGLISPQIVADDSCDGDNGNDGGSSGGVGSGGGDIPPEPAPPPPPPNDDPSVPKQLGTIEVTGHYTDGWTITQQYMRTVAPNNSGGYTDGPWVKGGIHNAHWTRPKPSNPNPTADCNQDPS